MNKRFFGTLLCLVMLLCVLATTAYAEGTAVNEVNLYLDDYEFGKDAADVCVTKNTTSAPFTVAETKLCDSAVTAEAITAAVACTGKIEANKDYWLVVKLKANEGYMFGGLASNKVFLYDCGEACVLNIDGEKTTAYAAFELEKLQAKFASIKYCRVGAKITDTYLSITPSWVNGDVSIAFSESPVTDNNWGANIISDSAETFKSDTNYYLRLTFKSMTALNSANDVRVRCWGLRNEPTASALYYDEDTGVYYAEFMLPKLTGQLDFTLQNYQTGNKADNLTLSLGGNTDGVIFDNVYKQGYFLADSMVKLYDYIGTADTDTGYLSVEGVMENTQQLQANKYYYLLVGLKAKDRYDIGYLADKSILTLKVGDYTYIEDPEEAIVSRWNKQLGGYTFFAFKLPMLGAERITRVDAAVREPVLGVEADQTPAILVTTDRTVHRFAGLDGHTLGDLEIKTEWRKIAAEDYSEDAAYYDWDEVEVGERFKAGYYYMFIVNAEEDYRTESSVGTYELSPAVIGAINNGGEHEFFRSNYIKGDYLRVERVFAPLEAHEHTRRQNTTANTADTTAPDTSKTDTVTSADTFDAGIALYAVLGALSLSGGAWLTGKKRT